MSKQRKWKYPITSGAYASWNAMRGRCTNPNDKSFDYYGGRGIRVCEEWESFDRFYEDMGDRPAGMTLDRKDSDKGYSPDNCRWIIASEQQGNQRRTIKITHEGITLTLRGWADKLGVPYYTLWNRIRCHGIPPERALTAESLNGSRV